MIRFVLSVVGLVGAWLWSRGARDPREWPQRLPQEIAALKRDARIAVAAGRRAELHQLEAFDEDLRRARRTAHPA